MKRLSTILYALLCTLLTNAQDFEVSPLTFNFNAEPGESQTKFLSVKNHSGKTETFILNISDYAVDNKGQGKYVEAGSLKNSIADWISIAPSFFELAPQEEKQISITMQQPADDYASKWGVIFARTAQEQTSFTADKNVSAGMAISARIAINVYQTPGSNKNFKATISNMSETTVKGDSIRSFSAIVNNMSDVITDCKVSMIATEINNGEEYEFAPTSFTMYPKSSRKIELYLPNGKLPKGTYSLAAILDYGSKTNLEGTQIVITVE